MLQFTYQSGGSGIAEVEIYGLANDLVLVRSPLMSNFEIPVADH